MDVKDNIYKYLEYKGISVAKAERDLGWSVGGLRKANSVTSDRLGKLKINTIIICKLTVYINVYEFDFDFD